MLALKRAALDTAILQLSPVSGVVVDGLKQTEKEVLVVVVVMAVVIVAAAEFASPVLSIL